MGAIVGFIVMVYACYRAYINYQLFSTANDTYGNIGSRSKNLPNYGLRIWGWIAVAALSAMSAGIVGR